MAPYQYQPLEADRGEIRLLKLLPGKFEDTIQIEILHTELPEKTHRASSTATLHYEALSYVWGPEENLQSITIRGARWRSVGKELMASLWISKNEQPERLYAPKTHTGMLSVRQNLSVALRHLRQASEGRILWIDAICINQKDVKERNREVGRMGQIYSKAARVVIWLGPEEDNSALAVRTLRLFAEDLSDEHVTDRSKGPYRRKGSRAALLIRNPDLWNTQIELKGSLPAIQMLFERPWFTRLWVYQECQLATNSMVVVGCDNIPLAELVRTGLWFLSASLPMLGSLRSQKLSQCTGIIIPRVAGSLSDLIFSTKAYGCQDPRDRIYALVALFPSTFKYSGKPDYRLRVEEVYKEFFLAYTRYNKALYIFGSPFARGLSTTSSKEIPSWKPDFACLLQPFQYGEASRKSCHHAIYSSTENTLQVHGIQITNVVKVHEAVPTNASETEILAKCVSWEPKDLYQRKYRTGQQLLEAFIEALVGGATREWQPNFLTVTELADEYTKHTTKGAKESAELSYANLSFKLRQYLHGRTFFSTSEGYFGICPSTTMLGDIVCVVLGFNFPLIFRPLLDRPGRFQLLGESYIPGLLRGEGISGPLPLSITTGRPWTMEYDLGTRKPIYTDGISRTQIDPRLPPLPLGWHMRFKFGDILQDDEYDSNGVMGTLRFVNYVEGRDHHSDPRLTPESLRARGVDIQDIIIV